MPTPTATTRSWPQQVLRFVGKIVFYFFVSSIGAAIFFRFVPIPITLTMIDRKITTGEKIHYDWTPYQEIAPEMALAVLASEDQRFPQHFGFDFEMMGNAFKNNLKGKRIKGASTISQQVAKNVFLWQGRSYFRKMLEAWFTLLIEVIWKKQRILEVYLNVAETGPMTFGVQAAAEQYFRKSAAQLTRTEAARIAAVLPSPNRFLIARPSAYVQRRTNSIVRQMRALGGKSYLTF